MERTKAELRRIFCTEDPHEIMAQLKQVFPGWQFTCWKIGDNFNQRSKRINDEIQQFQQDVEKILKPLEVG